MTDTETNEQSGSDELDSNKEQIEITEPYQTGNGPLFTKEETLARKLGVDPDGISSIKEIYGDGSDQFDWVNNGSLYEGKVYQVYVESDLYTSLSVHNQDGELVLQKEPDNRELKKNTPGASWQKSGLKKKHDEMVGSRIKLTLNDGTEVEKEITTGEKNGTETYGFLGRHLNKGDYRVAVEDGYIRWTKQGIVYISGGGGIFEIDEVKTEKEVESVEYLSNE